MAILSQRAYARHRGMRLSAVQKAIRSGRISTLPDGQIDSDMADEEWGQNTTPRFEGSSALLKARTYHEVYKGRSAELEYKRLLGELVPAAEVKAETFNVERLRRDAMLNIPDRVCAAIAAEVKDSLVAAGIAPELAGVVDTARVHTILTQEIRKAQNDYADVLNG